MLITTLDRIFRLAFALGAIALTAIVACYACEVVMRYFFNAPTRWASDTVSFLLLASVFLVAPWLTRENGHVAVTLLPDLLPEKWARLAIRLGYARRRTRNGGGPWLWRACSTPRWLQVLPS